MTGWIAAIAPFLLAVLWAGPASAQQPSDSGTIWSCRDKDGSTLLTSIKEDTVGKDCKVVQRQRVTVVPATKVPAKTAAPPGFPKESANDRTAAREKQRQTLERELDQEQQMLVDARRKLAEQEAVRTGEEKNYAKVLERLQPYRDAVEVHSKNIEALKRELSNLYR